MKTILLVDDSFIARSGIKLLCKELSLEVLEADGGEKALEIIKTTPPDLILLDLLMPEPDGFTVLKVLQDMEKAPPTIILSADIQVTTQKKCFHLGAAAFVKKPPKKEILLATIEEHLT
jgi:CheY-like chemotaxis protein